MLFNRLKFNMHFFTKNLENRLLFVYNEYVKDYPIYEIHTI